MRIEITDDKRRRLRSQFPALAGETIFLENAGGSQVPAVVAQRMHDYILQTYVQLGAGYEKSRHATTTVEEAHRFARLLMGGTAGEVVLGPSTSGLLQMLADCYARVLAPEQEIVVAEMGHEANIGPWVRLERQGLRIRWWKMDRQSLASPLDELENLLNQRTALVALPHVSNLLGEVVDLERVCKLSHRVGARVVVDGVAYAPHRAMAVEDWGVDWYAHSIYKVYGPHMGALWGRREAMQELAGPNHFFITETPYRFELGGVCHEACAGFLGLADYLKFVADLDRDAELDRGAIDLAFTTMSECERPLQAKLLGYLGDRTDVRLIGPAEDGPARVGTISFVHSSMSSRQIVEQVDHTEIAIRHGHMYAYRLCEAAGLDPADGVVRISLVHYNTPAEIDRLIEVLDRAMA